MNNGNAAHIPPGMLIRIIQDKQAMNAQYEQLHGIATDQQDIDIIGRIRLDEAAHLSALTGLFARLFGGQPELNGHGQLQMHSFMSGVKDLIIGELNLYITYSNIIFTDSNADVQNTFFQVLTDDNRHASRLNYMYTKAVESKLVQLP